MLGLRGAAPRPLFPFGGRGRAAARRSPAALARADCGSSSSSLCEPTGGQATTGLETPETGWVSEYDLPQDLFLARVLPKQMRRLLAHWRDFTPPTDVD
jgi:hypothetical protein